MRLVQAAVQQNEESQWRVRLLTPTTGKSPWYTAMKQHWGREQYLDCTSYAEVNGRKWKARMRCSAGLPLAATLFQEKRASSPLCILCDLQETEDQTHVMCVCPRYAGIRSTLFSVAVRTFTRWSSWWRTERAPWWSMTAIQRTQWLLKHDDQQLSVAVGVFLVAMFRSRLTALNHQE